MRPMQRPDSKSSMHVVDRPIAISINIETVGLEQKIVRESSRMEGTEHDVLVATEMVAIVRIATG